MNHPNLKPTTTTQPDATPTAARSPAAPIVALRDLPNVSLSTVKDVRGWRVQLTDGSLVGTVDRIFLDGSAREPRYLDVRIDPAMTTDGTTPGVTQTVSHALIPFGRAQLHATQDVVVLPTLNRANVQEMPKVTAPTVTREFELTLVKWFGRAVHPERSLYDSDVYDTEFFMAPRTPTSGTKSRKKA